MNLRWDIGLEDSGNTMVIMYKDTHVRIWNVMFEKVSGTLISLMLIQSRPLPILMEPNKVGQRDIVGR